uniref:Putative ovule protein n=1 Tax=Solanum chacoense TaxID=4108 RepID=A0A0V0H709_SOLCH
MKTGVSRRWILVDSKGQSSILDLDKYAIMKRVSIHARDLRILDPLLSYPSAIFGREKAIVLNLEVHLTFKLSKFDLSLTSRENNY